MRKILCLTLVLLVGSTTWAQDAKQAAAGKPTNNREKMSYSIGADIGRNLKNNEIGLSLQHFFAGIRDAFTGKPLALTNQELSAGVQNFQTEMRQKAILRAERTPAGRVAVKPGKDFLAANAKKPGVKTTSSGLQYKVIKSGNGATPKATDKVTTHYEGRLIDGKVFDSSYKRGEPATFPVNGVIKGWTEALQMMKEGDKWQLYIPHHLAYGPQGRPSIPPFAALIFDIELVEVEKQ